MSDKLLVISPVYNEAKYLRKFFSSLRSYYYGDVLFINDGSSDKSFDILREVKDNNTCIISHHQRKGYGNVLREGFSFALENNYSRIVTIDSDLQHNPQHLSLLFRELLEYEVVLGSRYYYVERTLSMNNRELFLENININVFKNYASNLSVTNYFHSCGILEKDKVLLVPRARYLINRYIASLLKVLFSLYFSDPFCGLRGYRISFLKKAILKDSSYGLSLEIILEIIRTRASFKELPIELIYINPYRKFLDGLASPRRRLLYYLDIISRKRKEILR